MRVMGRVHEDYVRQRHPGGVDFSPTRCQHGPPTRFHHHRRSPARAAAAIAGAVTQTAIFASRGFVRLMGIGHIYWVPLIPWLWSRLEDSPQLGRSQCG